ncbi:bis(5'-nucleosyl)-tetraphosphatase (symmetrical) ApaH [Buchnera aphidicola]|uniref:bis(5'-nucleosyl)-tetraphosphatase (symmetrical) ApaH n=1 Tax=Buchnera aphidicola TaxID=9 RepID=UPI003464BCBB
MSTYFIGDIHGCYTQLMLLLKKANFNAKKDYLWIAGDLVARGPDSIKVLRYLYSLQDHAKIVLGNHDLNLISVFFGKRQNKKENAFNDFFFSKDSEMLMHWLRHQPLLQIDEDRKIIMSHAGISPYWDVSTAKSCAKGIEECLSSQDYIVFLESMYNNNVMHWQLNLTPLEKLQYSINVLTRMRYCYPNGQLDLTCKEIPCFAKKPLQPWFLMKKKISKEYSIFFGHWSSLKNTRVLHPFYPLDYGCCWGGELAMIRWEDKKYFFQSNKK